MTLLVVLALGLVTIPLTTFATGAVLLRLPADHFVRPRRTWSEAWRGSFKRKLGTAARNALGILLLVAGGLMLIPGVPGPGLLTVLLGLTLVDFPGKQALQRRVFQSSRFRNRVDRLRARFGRPALQYPPPDASPRSRPQGLP